MKRRTEMSQTFKRQQVALHTVASLTRVVPIGIIHVFAFFGKYMHYFEL